MQIEKNMNIDSTKLREIDVMSVMIHTEVMDQFNSRVKQELNACTDITPEAEMHGFMVMYIDDQGFIYMNLSFENGCNILYPVSPVDWLPRYAA